MKPRVLALYLPQFHPFPENDEWWGKGFTEWRSVVRATPLYRGHYQPHIPADLGFYDLRVPEIREQQAQMAREAGIEGFCYWHYWFGGGKRLMERIFDEVLESGKPDFPFCLGWANHSWFAKNWNSADTKGKDRLLIEQTYPGEEDFRAHYQLVRKAFLDKRYVKVGNKPFFMIYEPKNVPPEFYACWTEWAQKDGFDGIYFVGNCAIENSADDMCAQYGLSAVVKNRIQGLTTLRKSNFWARQIYKMRKKLDFLHLTCEKYDYATSLPKLINTQEDSQENVIPYIIPNFDHSPRSGRFGYILDKSTPALFYQHCRQVFDLVSRKQHPIVLLRSWNEWGEGNYVEPDLKFGRGYLEALAKALSECQ